MESIGYNMCGEEKRKETKKNKKITGKRSKATYGTQKQMLEQQVILGNFASEMQEETIDI